jgi:hypothetical protein
MLFLMAQRIYLRKLCLLVFSSAFSMTQSHLYGQEAIPATKNREIGLNITNTIAGFLSADGNVDALDRFIISYKVFNPNTRRAVRMACNITFDDNSTDNNFGSSREDKSMSLDYRVGIERRRPITPRFTSYFGFDMVLNYNQEKVVINNDNGFGNFRSSLITRGGGLGLGPVMGFQFQLHSRIILSTEAAFYLNGSVQRQLLEIQPDPVEEITKRRLHVIPIIPSSLWVNISF